MRIKNHLLKIYLRKIKRLSLPRDLIRYAVSRNYAKVAIVDQGKESSYGQLYERSKKLANALLSLELRKGDRLAVLLYNCREYFELRIASYLSGIVLVPLVWDLELNDIISILSDCDVKALIYHHQIFSDQIQDIRNNTRIKHFIPVLGKKERSPYEDLIAQGSLLEPRVELKLNDLASINFSSGTTARSKGVMLTQGSWSASFYNYLLNSKRAQLGQRVVLHVLSLATAGSTAFLPTFFLGAKNVVLEKIDLARIVTLILQYKVNNIFLSPSLLISLLDYCKAKDIGLPLSNIIIGTETMPQQKFKEAIGFFGPIIQQGYGMAEVLPPLSLLSCEDYMVGNKLNEERLLSVGKIIKDVELKVVNSANKDLPFGKRGRIVLKSATLSQGYWNNPELTKAAYRNNYFYSDDYGYVAKEGYLYVLGRKEDIIKTAHPVKEGKHLTVFAREIEEVLHRHPAVLEAFVFCANSAILACVCLRSNSSGLSEKALIDFCARNLDKRLLPSTIAFLPELPKGASGKINKKLLKMQFRLKRFERKNG